MFVRRFLFRLPGNPRFNFKRFRQAIKERKKIEENKRKHAFARVKSFNQLFALK